MFFEISIKPVFSKSQALYARFNKLNLDLDICGNENLTDKVQSNIYEKLLNRQKSAYIVLHMAEQVASSVRVCLLWLGGASGHIGGGGGSWLSVEAPLHLVAG